MSKDKETKRITISWVSELGMYRAYFTDNEGEGPYGEGYSQDSALRELLYEEWDENERRKEMAHAG